MKVPFLDLKVQYRQIQQEILAALGEVLETCAFSGGPIVQRFEEAFAQRHGVKHCIACSSGTSALHLALMAMGIGSGDEVIVPVNTFIATAAAVSHCGATPVFVDMSATDFCIDPQKITYAITPRTKAIIPVHLYGQPAEMDAILAIAARHGLRVLEDCAQAHDAEFRGRKVGTFGDAASFSFYPGKNLGAYGEGGAVLTRCDRLAYNMRVLRDHGASKKYHHEVVGYNYRMEGFQAAVLCVKLKYLQDWTEARCRAAQRYRQVLAGFPLIHQPPKPHVRHVHHLFVIRVSNRDAVAARLNQAQIGTGIHYPIPLHLTQAYAHLGHAKGSFPVAEAAAGQLLSLPMYPELTDEQITYVCGQLRECLWGSQLSAADWYQPVARSPESAPTGTARPG